MNALLCCKARKGIQRKIITYRSRGLVLPLAIAGRFDTIWDGYDQLLFLSAGLNIIECRGVWMSDGRWCRGWGHWRRGHWQKTLDLRRWGVCCWNWNDPTTRGQVLRMEGKGWTRNVPSVSFHRKAHVDQELKLTKCCAIVMRRKCAQLLRWTWLKDSQEQSR